MTHKVNPHGLRVGIIKNWQSKWDGSTEQTILIGNGRNFKNLEICSNVTIFGTKKDDVVSIVETVKKR